MPATCYQARTFPTMALPSISKLSQFLPMDLADDVAKRVHTLHMDTLKHEILHAISPFEVAMTKADPLGYLHDKHAVAEYVDEWVDWLTVIILFPTSRRFVLFHEYVDGPCQERILLEGFLEHTSIKLERTLFVTPTIRATDVDAFCALCPNSIPLQFLGDQVHTPLTMASIDRNYYSNKTWRDGDNLIDWFLQTH